VPFGVLDDQRQRADDAVGGVREHFDVRHDTLGRDRRVGLVGVHQLAEAGIRPALQPTRLSEHGGRQVSQRGLERRVVDRPALRRAGEDDVPHDDLRPGRGKLVGQLRLASARPRELPDGALGPLVDAHDNGLGARMGGREQGVAGAPSEPGEGTGREPDRGDGRQDDRDRERAADATRDAAVAGVEAAESASHARAGCHAPNPRVSRRGVPTRVPGPSIGPRARASPFASLRRA
jgi:hypothetical protein